MMKQPSWIKALACVSAGLLACSAWAAAVSGEPEVTDAALMSMSFDGSVSSTLTNASVSSVSWGDTSGSYTLSPCGQAYIASDSSGAPYTTGLSSFTTGAATIVLVANVDDASTSSEAVMVGISTGATWSVGTTNAIALTIATETADEVTTRTAKVLVSDGSSNTTLVSATVPTSSTGYHTFVVTLDSTNGASLTIDGTTTTSSTAFTSISMAGFQLGGFYGGVTQGSFASGFTTGAGIAYDELRLYGSVLSSENITAFTTAYADLINPSVAYTRTLEATGNWSDASWSDGTNNDVVGPTTTTYTVTVTTADTGSTLTLGEAVTLNTFTVEGSGALTLDGTGSITAATTAVNTDLTLSTEGASSLGSVVLAANTTLSVPSSDAYTSLSQPTSAILEFKGGDALTSLDPDSLISTGRTLQIAKTVTTDTLLLTNRTLSIVDGANITVSTRLRTAETGSYTDTINQTGGTISCTGAANSSYKLGAFVLAHWPGTTNYNLSGGTLSVENSVAKFGADGTGNLTITGTGVANLHSISLYRGTITVGEGGTLNFGKGTSETGAISRTAGNLVLNGGTLGPWTNTSMTIGVPVTVSANSTIRTSTSEETAQASILTITGAISGSGTLVANGLGTLDLTGATLTDTALQLSGGTLKVDSEILTGASAVTVDAGQSLTVVLTDAEISAGVDFSSKITLTDTATVIFTNSNGDELTGTTDGSTYTPAAKVWQGGSATWMVGDETTNWDDGIAFTDGTDVRFNTQDAETTVTVSGTVAPGTATVSVTNDNLSFTGGEIAGTTFNKTGSGAVTVDSTLSATNVNILEGTLDLASAEGVTTTVSSAIAGNTTASTLKKSGTGTTALTGSMSTVDNLTVAVEEGTLVWGTAGSAEAKTGFSPGAVTIASGATLSVGARDALSTDSTYAISGTLESSGYNNIGAITLTGGTIKTTGGYGSVWSAMQYNGNITVESGDAAITSDDESSDTYANRLATAVTVNTSADDAKLTISARLRDGVDSYGNAITGSITKNGSGTLRLANANNDFSGGITVSAGTLEVAPGANAGSGAIANSSVVRLGDASTDGTVTAQVTGGTVQVQGNVTWDMGGTSTESRVTSVETLSGVDGTLTVTNGILGTSAKSQGAGSGFFTVPLTIGDGGTLMLDQGDGSGWSATTAITLATGGTLAVERRDTLKRPITFAGGTLTIAGQDTNYGNRALDIYQGVTFTVTEDSQITGIAGGDVYSSSGSSITVSSEGTVNNPVAALREGNLTCAVAEGKTFTIAASLSSLNGYGNSTAYVLTKNGTGTMIWDGKTLEGEDTGYNGRYTSTFPSTTSVTEGTYIVNVQQLSAGAYTVSSGAALGGAGDIQGSVTFADGAILDATQGTLTASSVTLGGALTVKLPSDTEVPSTGTQVLATTFTETGTVANATVYIGDTADTSVQVTIAETGLYVTKKLVIPTTGGSDDATLDTTAQSKIAEALTDSTATSAKVVGATMTQTAGGSTTLSGETINNALTVFDNIITVSEPDADGVATVTVGYDFGISSIKPVVGTDGAVTLVVTATVQGADGDTTATYADGTTVELTVGTETPKTMELNGNTATITIDVPDSGTELSVKASNTSSAAAE